MIDNITRKFFLQYGLICPHLEILFPLLVLSDNSKILFSKKNINRYFRLLILTSLLITLLPLQISAKNRGLNRWLTTSFNLANNEYEGIASIKISNDPFDAAIKARRKAIIHAIETSGVIITSRSTLSSDGKNNNHYSERIDMVSSNKILATRTLSSFVSKNGFIWYHVAIKIEQPVEVAMIGQE